MPYITNCLNHPKRSKVIDKTVRDLKSILKRIHFDAIAFRGLSGGLVAPIVAHKLELDLMCIRKPNDGAHSYRQVEYHPYEETGIRNYIIIDDFVCSGNTIREILKAIEKDSYYKGESICKGLYLYNYADNSSGFSCILNDIGIDCLNPEFEK